MSMLYIGAVVGIAGTAYSVYSSQAAISAANSAKPKAFKPINIPQVAAMALSTDEIGYKLSDADWQKRFPKLVLGRDHNIADVGNNLAGQMSPTVTNEMSKAGLGANLGDTTMEQSKNLGLPGLALEQRGRNYFQKQLAMNPQRAAGLTGTDVTRMAVANTGSQNNFNQGVYQSRIAQYNAGLQQNVQNTNAGINAFGSLADLVGPSYQRSPYETGAIFSGASGPTTNQSGNAPYGWPG